MFIEFMEAKAEHKRTAVELTPESAERLASSIRSALSRGVKVGILGEGVVTTTTGYTSACVTPEH